MNVSGPSPITPAQRPEEAAIALRLNQRFAAEVLQVAGDRVLLSVDGVRFVARLVAADQATALLERRLAQFVVRDASASTIVLQLVQPEAPPAAAPPSPQELIPNLLDQAGLPVNPATTAIARALLSHGFAVTAEGVSQLLEILTQRGEWSEAQAQAAAALRSLGLPLTPETLALVQSGLPALETLIAELRVQLRALARRPEPSEGRPPLSPSLAEMVQQALDILDGLSADWDEVAPALAERLRQAVALMGRPLEAQLADLSDEAPLTLGKVPRRSLLALALIRRDLASRAPQTLLDKLDRLLDGLRLVQFLNARPEAPPLRGQWLRLDLPLALPNPGRPDEEPSLHTAQLRVAYRSEGDGGIDPANTRLVLRFELAAGVCAGEVLQVDLSIAGQWPSTGSERRLGMSLTASSEKLRRLAQQELDSLQSALEQLGYRLLSVNWAVGDSIPPPSPDAPAIWRTFNEVSLEV